MLYATVTCAAQSSDSISRPVRRDNEGGRRQQDQRLQWGACCCASPAGAGLACVSNQVSVPARQEVGRDAAGAGHGPRAQSSRGRVAAGRSRLPPGVAVQAPARPSLVTCATGRCLTPGERPDQAGRWPGRFRCRRPSRRGGQAVRALVRRRASGKPSATRVLGLLGSIRSEDDERWQSRKRRRPAGLGPGGALSCPSF